jgi:hypothetical protein
MQLLMSWLHTSNYLFGVFHLLRDAHRTCFHPIQPFSDIPWGVLYRSAQRDELISPSA